MDLLLLEKDGKAFHDPTAAYLMMKPENGTWICGTPSTAKTEWCTLITPTSNTKVLVDINREIFWNDILNFKICT